LRGEIVVEKNASKDDILSLAKSEPSIANHIAGKQLLNEIYIPGRIVNLVV
jgi:leucyl-tRNA synthetase